MNIEFGSIEYFELLSFEDRLKGYRLDNLDLQYLDLLRAEVARKIGAINLHEKERIEREKIKQKLGIPINPTSPQP